MRNVAQKLQGTRYVDIARTIGVDLSYVSLIFSGKRQPSFHVARSLCSYLDVSLDDLAAYLDSISVKTAVAA